MKKFCVLVFLVLFLFSCATVAKISDSSKDFKIWDKTYQVPASLPDFTKWPGDFMPVHSGAYLVIVGFEACNPANNDEWILAIFAAENKNGTPDPYLIGVNHSPSIQKIVSGKGKTYTYIDKEYLEKGLASFVLTPGESNFDVKKLILMKSKAKKQVL